MRQDRRASLLKAAGVDVAGLAITYTGTKTDQIVTMSGVAYRLLTLITSGTLTVPEQVTADVWMCGGGTSGSYAKTSSNNSAGSGGAGGFTKNVAKILNGSLVAVIGAGGYQTSSLSAIGAAQIGGASSFDGAETSINFFLDQRCISGGSGGGAAKLGYYEGTRTRGGLGAGEATIPFGDSSFNPHCAGGGGGGVFDYSGSTNSSIGGDGGTNGGNGGLYVIGTNYDGGAGGSYGGGNGGKPKVSDGYNGSFYGAGGGGGQANLYTEEWGAAGAGYQGVIYVRIPLAQ